ncbi:MAG: hypothetical protein IPK58_09330 [Acidobacteria bacterium]|nr:hypothetical protein [Acidobacteriota bacterium]
MGFGIWDLGALKNRPDGSKSRFLQNTDWLNGADLFQSIELEKDLKKR